jgi:hypothetical protein
MKRYGAALVVAGLSAAASLLWAPVQAAPALQFSIKDARAYSYKVSLHRDVVRNLPPTCDAASDPYECDEGRYNHKPNCPKGIEIGRRGKLPKTEPPPDVTPTEGGAGDETGGAKPSHSSPVRLNEIVAIGSLSHLGGSVQEASGLASEQYIELSGRGEPESHTESDGFSPNKPSWEERCWPEQANEAEANDYVHTMSRSSDEITTEHLAECFRRGCAFQAPTPGTFGATAEKGRSIVTLAEDGSQVRASLSAKVEDLNYGDGAFTVESIETHVTISSDGTPQRLRWSVTSTASGAEIGGQPVTLPPGQVVSLPGLSVGMAAPYVEATADGGQLTLVAPGLMIAHDEQAAYFGGAEFYGSFGEFADVTFGGPQIDPTIEVGTGGGTSGFDSGVTVGSTGVSVGGPGLSGGIALGTGVGGEEPVAAGETSEILVYEQATGRGAMAGLLAAGLIGWFLLITRWVQRFSWGRRLIALQPFRFIDWLYRSFVKA